MGARSADLLSRVAKAGMAGRNVGQTVDDARSARRNPAGTLGTGNEAIPDPGPRGACDRHHTHVKPQTNETRGDIPMSTLPIARTLTLAAVGSLWLAAGGHAVTITATLDPAGPIQVNDEFDVDLSASGWNAAMDGGVDAVDLLVDYDFMLFEFVTGAADLNVGEFLDDPPSQGGGYDPEGDVHLVVAGRALFSVFDKDDAGASQKAGGTLGTLTFKAIAVGTGDVTPKAGAGGEDSVFSDIGFSGILPTGGVSFAGASMTVVPEPASAGLVVIGLATLLGLGTARRGAR